MPCSLNRWLCSGNLLLTKVRNLSPSTAVDGSGLATAVVAPQMRFHFGCELSIHKTGSGDGWKFHSRFAHFMRHGSVQPLRVHHGLIILSADAGSRTAWLLVVVVGASGIPRLGSTRSRARPYRDLCVAVVGGGYVRYCETSRTVAAGTASRVAVTDLSRRMTMIVHGLRIRWIGRPCRRREPRERASQRQYPGGATTTTNTMQPPIAASGDRIISRW